MSMVVTEFLAVDYPSTFNSVIGRLLLKALRVMTSIHCLTMKFPTTSGTRQVRRRKYDSRECHNKSLELVENERQLSRIEVEKTSKGSMEINIDSRL